MQISLRPGKSIRDLPRENQTWPNHLPQWNKEMWKRKGQWVLFTFFFLWGSGQSLPKKSSGLNGDMGLIRAWGEQKMGWKTDFRVWWLVVQSPTSKWSALVMTARDWYWYCHGRQHPQQVCKQCKTGMWPGTLQGRSVIQEKCPEPRANTFSGSQTGKYCSLRWPNGREQTLLRAVLQWIKRRQEQAKTLKILIR